MSKPLSGIRIADFTVHNAGPFCTHILSQLGAEIRRTSLDAVITRMTGPGAQQQLLRRSSAP